MTGADGNFISDVWMTTLACDLLRSGQRVRLVARGWSMWPVLRDGDSVEIAPARAQDLKPGEIGAWETGAREAGGLVLHRLVRWEASGARGIFRGDACPAPDSPVAAEQVVGRVTACWRGRRQVGTWGYRGRLALCLQPVWRVLFAIASGVLRFYRGGPSLLPGSAERVVRERVLLNGAQGIFSGSGVFSRAGGVEAIVSCVLNEPAYQHLLPLVARACRVGEVEGGHPGLRERLQAEEDRALFHSAQAEGLLRHLAAILERAGVEMLVVKGAALAFTGVYAESHLRQGADVDTLCLPGQERLLTELLLQDGFENAEPEYPVDYYLRYRGEVAFFHRSAPRWPTLELHWVAGGSLFYGRRLSVERLWRESRPGPWGKGLRVLSPEMELLHSLVHLTKHLRVLRPVWALDIALLARQGMDWACVEREIVAARLEWPAWLVFEWVESRVPGTVPSDLIRRVRAGRARGLRAWPEMRMLHAVRSRQTRWIEALCLPTWRQRLGYLSEQALPSRFVMERLYPESKGRWLVPWYLRRWGRLAREILRRDGKVPGGE